MRAHCPVARGEAGAPVPAVALASAGGYTSTRSMPPALAVRT